ncbi:MAG: hypothetical protein LRZ88_13595 [Candidatus Cloacimonetes bacterium]|nr:hypothetical protein [Candidatus Cloacimonadota bacterium]
MPKKMAILSKKHDLIAMQVLDESELELPNAGVVRMQDHETGRVEYVNTASGALRKAYKAKVDLEQQALAARLKAMACDHILFRNHDSYVKVLRQFFVLRSKRRHG